MMNTGNPFQEGWQSPNLSLLPSECTKHILIKEGNLTVFLST